MASLSHPAPIARTFANANVVYRRPLAETGVKDYLPSPDLFDHPPRHGRGLPAMTFKVVSEYGHLETIHIGHGLTVEDVVAEESSHCYDPTDDAPDPLLALDKTILEDGRVVAIVRDLNDGQGSYKVLRIDAVWTPVGELVAEPDGDEREWVRDGYASADEARLATLRKYPTAWTITSAGETLYLTRADRSLDEVISEALCGFDGDMTIWRGSELAATIRGDSEGSPVIERFDAANANSLVS